MTEQQYRERRAELERQCDIEANILASIGPEPEFAVAYDAQFDLLEMYEDELAELDKQWKEQTDGV